MRQRSVAVVVFCCVALVAAMSAGAIDIPSPPPQTAEERAPYNEALNFPDSFSSTCCNVHPEVGCDDPVCTQTICAYDPWCCQVNWDSICVYEAFQDCAVCRDQIPQTIPTASRTGLFALAGGLLVAGTALLIWRRKRAA